MSNCRLQGATGEWEVVIGLEVQAQVMSDGKLLPEAATAFRRRLPWWQAA